MLTYLGIMVFAGLMTWQSIRWERRIVQEERELDARIKRLYTTVMVSEGRHLRRVK